MEYINVWAVLVCGIAATVLGSLWYSPLLFGKIWMKSIGVTEDMMRNVSQKKMIPSYIAQLVAAIFTALILNILITAGYHLTTMGAVRLAVVVWLGFTATPMFGMVLWEKKPWKIFLIVSVYHLVSLVISALILSSWR